MVAIDVRVIVAHRASVIDRCYARVVVVKELAVPEACIGGIKCGAIGIGAASRAFVRLGSPAPLGPVQAAQTGCDQAALPISNATVTADLNVLEVARVKQVILSSLVFL